MVGTKFLSEVVTTDMLVKDKLNVIKAPTGSGKTYFALTAIPAAVPDAIHRVVYLIDTINGKEQILQNYNACPHYRGWEVETKEEALWFETDSRVVVITYAKFGVLLNKDPDFHKHFDYIICDELHSLFKFIYFEPQPNVHSAARDGIKRAILNGRSTVIALSATPESIERKFDAPCYNVPIDDHDLIHYDTKEIIPYTNLDYLLTTLDPCETGICYVSRIHTMKALEEEAREVGLHPISMWSINNADHSMSEEQLYVRQRILHDFEIPAEYNLLFINSSSETSLKIKSHVDYVIVHSGNEETQVQVRGRVNNDLSRLYLPSNDLSALTVPDDFLNRKLFTEDKTELCEIVNQRNASGRQFRWRTVKDRLIECGYSISDGRIHDRRYSIINPPAE